MLFSSPLFLFFFLPLFAIAYSVVPMRLKNSVILAGSLFFYAWAEPKFIALVLLSALIDFVSAHLIYTNSSHKTRMFWLWLGISTNVGLLFYFKYANFMLDNLSPVLKSLGLTRPELNLYLPIGISFIVFEKITYLVDVYKRVGKPANSFSSYLTYVFFFPKLLAGPIVKYHDIVDQFASRPQRLKDVQTGIYRFIVGLAKKLFIADALSPVVDAIFKANSSQIGTAYAWCGALFFALQIYFDFSGYSDMAIGMARMMGFKLRENFNLPYTAISFTQFWHRWHISLSSWILEYLYIPLGGSRISNSRTYCNLWICFLLSGLWHGAAWTFVFWGFYHGTALICDRLFWTKFELKAPKVLSHALTLFFLILGWVFFRAETMPQALHFLRAMFTFHVPTQYIAIDRSAISVAFIGAFFSLINTGKLFHNILNKTTSLKHIQTTRLVRAVTAICLLVLCFARASASSFHPFLYFRF